MEHMTKIDRQGQLICFSIVFVDRKYENACFSGFFVVVRNGEDETRIAPTGTGAFHAGHQFETAFAADRLLHHVRRFGHNSGLPRNIHLDPFQPTALHHWTTGIDTDCLTDWVELLSTILVTRNQHLAAQLYALRGLKRGNPNQNKMKSSTSTSTADPMGNNYRPIQPTHHRPVRTNIDFTSSEVMTLPGNLVSASSPLPLHPFIQSKRSCIVVVFFTESWEGTR